MPDDSTLLFRVGQSRYHRLHPSSKLLIILLTAVAVYLGPGRTAAAMSFISLNLILAACSGLLVPLWGVMWRTMLPLALSMTIIHGLFHPGRQTILLALGPVTVYQEGLGFSAAVLLQLAAVLSSSLLFAFSTHPADLITAICQAGWPPAFGYLLGSPLLLIPAMRERVRTIQAAQRARGLATSGSLRHRCRALFPLVIPLVLGALVEVEERAIALEIRSFNASGNKTAWRVLSDSPGQKISRRAMLAAIVVILAYRLSVTWTSWR